MRSATAFISLMVLVGLGLTAHAPVAHAQEREQGKLLQAKQVLDELRNARDQTIPERLLDRAYGIAVIPDVTKVALIAGGRRGRGVLVVRDKNGHFTNPIFITITGGSIGWQAGVQSTDIVLVFTTREGIEGITDGKLTLGADASVAAGPVGRQASASTDASFTAEVYSYSRNRGLFAGIALDGSALNIDRGGNGAFYRKSGVTASDIINGDVTTDDDAAKKFMTSVATSTRTNQAAAGSSSSTNAPAAPATPVSAPPAGGVQTFPMEDPTPGGEPR